MLNNKRVLNALKRCGLNKKRVLKELRRLVGATLIGIATGLVANYIFDEINPQYCYAPAEPYIVKPQTEYIL